MPILCTVRLLGFTTRGLYCNIAASFQMEIVRSNRKWVVFDISSHTAHSAAHQTYHTKCQNIAFANKNFEQFSILMWGHSRVPFERHTFCPPFCDALDSSSVCIVFPLNTLRGIKCKNIVFPWSPTQKNPSHSQTRDCKEFQTQYFIPKTHFKINLPIYSETEDGIA